MGNYCEACFEKQRTIDKLQEEVRRLKEQLKYRRNKEAEGFFGSSTPSSQIPVKANTDKKKQRRKKGAKTGHAGKGRTSCPPEQAAEVIELDPVKICSHCEGDIVIFETTERTVIESEPLRPKRRVYRCPHGRCAKCGRFARTKAPSVLPKSLYGNQLIANAAVMHYVHGVPIGRICEQLGIGAGTLMGIFHRLAGFFKNVPDTLVLEYRASWVRHADETGWRKEGNNGYAWLFATDNISIFLFGRTRAASVAKEILGEEPLPGYLVVDRYSGYNWVLCIIQYCYAHLLRDVEDLEKDFPGDGEVKAFVAVMAPLLALAIKLRKQPLSDEEFYEQARKVKSDIVAAVKHPALHLGIRHLQDVFQEQEHRMYHWAVDRRVPADNNLAERGVRPTVVARKVSFGSQSDAGAETRGILMTVLCTLRKRGFHATAHLKTVLDKLAEDLRQDPFPLLFPPSPVTPEKNTRAKMLTKISTPAPHASVISMPSEYACAVPIHMMMSVAHSP
jgi:hypothetical protein